MYQEKPSRGHMHTVNKLMHACTVSVYKSEFLTSLHVISQLKNALVLGNFKANPRLSIKASPFFVFCFSRTRMGYVVRIF